ncbi:MAG TPA: protein kinase [Kofleriaceae bacterium]|nr:protein kinase [Kofleriaceae bacterium]
MRYEDYTLVLSDATEADGHLTWNTQVTAAAGLPAIIEPVRSRCQLAALRVLSQADPWCPPRMTAQLEAGHALGEALLPGVVGTRMREALHLVRARSAGLRLRIVGGDLVHGIPWEYAVLSPDLGEPTETDLLALMPDVSVVRDQSIPYVPFTTTAPPLRIAAAAAHPACVGQIDVLGERLALEGALRDLHGIVELVWSPDGARPSAATRAQIFHFAGHGAVELTGLPSPSTRDVESGDTVVPGSGPWGTGYLIFEGPGGTLDRVTAGQLGVILREMGVRVAVLNACRTASRDGSRSWGSVACALLKAGVRSVVAMQHAVLDASAVTFASAFYRSLALGGSLDQAARNGRIAVFDRGDGFGWGTPVLYLCGADGQVFPEAARVEGHRAVLQDLDERTVRSYRARVARNSTGPRFAAVIDDTARARIRLCVIEGPDRGRTFALKPRDRFVMGRAPTAHFQLTHDGFFSRHHLMVETNSPEVLVRDLKSMNGTFVNQRRITKPTLLRHGDVISGGKTRVRLELDGPDGLARARQPRRDTGAPDASRPRGGLAIRCSRCSAGALVDQLWSAGDGMLYLCAACQAALIDDPPVPPGYRIASMVGRGMISAVYLAVHAVMGRRAIRWIVPRVATSLRMREVFVQQAAPHAALEHSHIARLFEVQEMTGGVFCAVTEYVEGGTAGDLVKHSPGGLDVQHAIAIIAQALEGLAHAHAHGFVHHDLNDSNLLIGRDEREQRIVKIADFGLTRSCETSGISGFTAPGDVVRAATYMAPERILNLVDRNPASDLYSMGAILYYLLTGEHAFSFGARAEPIVTVLENEIRPIAQRKPSVPGAVAAAIERAMQKDPLQRFRDAAEMQQALLAAAGDAEPPRSGMR